MRGSTKDLWPEDPGPWIRFEPDDLALLTLPPPKPNNPFDCIPPEKLFAAGVTPECYLCWQSDRTRDIVWSCLRNHPKLDLATALIHIWWAPMI
jgi:hypothetical protein